MTIEQLEKDGFSGLDVNLSISLADYGLAWKVENGEIRFIYGTGIGENDIGETIHNRFSWGWLEIGDFDREFNWIGKMEISRFIGLTMEEFSELDFLEKVIIAYQYYGGMEIFGESYGNDFEVEGVEEV